MTAETSGLSGPSPLQSAIEECLSRHHLRDKKLCVALSGGRDSVVLLHLLGASAEPGHIRAIHVDHGLHPESPKWAGFCAGICTTLAVPFQVCKVTVPHDSGLGLEASARASRYAALADALAPDEVLVTAHHRNDQAETLLLQLLRGAGPHGLASMPECVRRDGLVIVRPLLSMPARVIREYAERHDLQWVEDPSNEDRGLDRNYLRQEIFPRLEHRWPAAVDSIARSARLAGEVTEMLDALADQDLMILQAGNRIDAVKLGRLSGSRQRNALRRFLRGANLAIPSERQLKLLLDTMAGAGADAQPLIAWPGVRVRRYRGQLWFFADSADPQPHGSDPTDYRWNPEGPLDMGAVRGRLIAQACVGEGIAATFGDAELIVRFRQGGESLRPAPAAASRHLKNLLQESRIVPWMRGHIPLVYRGDDLLAVGDMWVNADCAAGPDEPGMRIVWDNHPAIR